ncbi:hypothetical protein F1D05_16030 [Kribbella qitaiheensis]|uniref:Uncharacterized protein n=1 Tax=Kribbella qitaiheensis TaxID=1544730 RepID=A0A7G6WYT1_9ACTN|nr:hypothetical protein [Kribbella qitaiheensis]QNE19146.1 hypothetical protein F1D05_16030 [Kribbella qitaiheensis]
MIDRSREFEAGRVARSSGSDGPLAHLQHTAGNAAVCQLLSSLRSTDLAEIRSVEPRADRLDLYAGAATAQVPPGGMDAIQSNEASSALGAAAGWTGIKMAGAFVTPNFTTSWIRPAKPGEDHFVTVDPPVASPDAVHDSFFPAPGDHKWGTHTAPGAKGKTYAAWHRVSTDISGLIQRGEQEHLDDARRAYDLSYGLITSTITGMAAQKFGPAKTPAAAEQLATDAFDAKLPAALSVKQPGYRGAWLAMLETLLRQSKLRDLRQWHDIEHAKPLTETDRYIYPLQSTPTTKIGVPSDQVVNYPTTP